MYRNAVIKKDFGFVPRADLPRSQFVLDRRRTTTIGFDNVTPIFAVECLPTDRWNFGATFFGRLLTPVVPILDNIWLEVFYFFCPIRLLWSHAENFFSGKNPDPTDSTTYVTPKIAITNMSTHAAPGTLWDHFGLPVYGQPSVGAGTLTSVVNAFYFRAYAAIWNEWFRDPNWVQPKLGYTVPGIQGDGPDTDLYLYPLKRYKRKDYITGALPWPQASTSTVQIPVTTGFQIVGNPGQTPTWTNGGDIRSLLMTNGSANATWTPGNPTGTGSAQWNSPQLQATQSAVQAAMGTINDLRVAYQTQKLLERDARGGPRYTEQLYSHYGILSQDQRMQRPEYLGSARKNLTVSQVPQTSATAVTGSTTALGNLAAFVTAHMDIRISASIPEHGVIIGVANVTGDVSYQQGIPREQSRSTRLDYYWPEFAMLGEQPIYRREIFSTCVAGNTDTTILGYQERWGEYRQWMNEKTGYMRSGISGTLDVWHLAENFPSAPTIGATFLEQNTPINRVLADTTNYDKAALKLDILHSGVVARPLPMFSVPGMSDHF